MLTAKSLQRLTSSVGVMLVAVGQAEDFVTFGVDHDERRRRTEVAVDFTLQPLVVVHGKANFHDEPPLPESLLPGLFCVYAQMYARAYI